MISGGRYLYSLHDEDTVNQQDTGKVTNVAKRWHSLQTNKLTLTIKWDNGFSYDIYYWPEDFKDEFIKFKIDCNDWIRHWSEFV